MATKGTPNGGLDLIADRVYISGADFTLVAYLNAADSLNAATVASDLTQPATANGYAPITLDGTWTSTNGITGYTPNPSWTPTGSWGGAVTGVAMISGTEVVHFMDLDSAYTVAQQTAGTPLTVDLDTVVA